MACAHAKFTGELGVCLATSGPGAIHLLNGLYDAKLDHQPVVAIVGQQARAALGGDYQQEVDLLSLFKDVAHEYVQMATRPGAGAAPRRPRLAHRARRAHGHLPHRPERRAGDGGRARRRRTSTAPSTPASATRAPRVVPARRRPARGRPRCSTPGEQVAMLVGAGALGATDEVIEVAELLGAGVAKALLGKAARARRPAVRHRRDRPARHAAELGADAAAATRC